MAFTTTQVFTIRTVLGYPSVNLFRDPKLEGRIATASADPDASAKVIELLALIASYDTALGPSASAMQTAGLKRAEDVEWFPPGSSTSISSPILNLKAGGRNAVARISSILGVEIWSDYYGTRGHQGDGYTSTANQMGGAINLG